MHLNTEIRPAQMHSPWRFIAWQVDFQSKTAKTYWDGRLVSNCMLTALIFYANYTM